VQLGFAAFLSTIGIAFLYSTMMPKVYEADFGLRIGRIPNVPTITKIASLTLISKSVWRLFEKNDVELIASRESLVRELQAAFGMEESPSGSSFVYQVSSREPDLLTVRIRSKDPEELEVFAKKIADEVVNSHREIFDEYLRSLSDLETTVRMLAEQFEREVADARESLDHSEGLGWAFLVDRHGELLIEADRLKFLRLPPTAMPTEALGLGTFKARQVEPNYLLNVLAFALVGAAIGLSLPLILNQLSNFMSRWKHQ